MSLRYLFPTFVIIGVLGVCAGTAAAGNPHGVVLDTAKTVAVDYTHCFDTNGNPLACVSPDFTVTNNSDAAVVCDIYVEELNFDITFGGPIAAGTSAVGALTAPYSGYKRLTLVLSCDGSSVPGETARIRVLVP
jgi:hypothetical protein